MEHLRLTIWQVWGGALGGLLLIWAVMWVLVGLKFIVSFFDPDHWAGPKELIIGIAVLLISVGSIFFLVPKCPSCGAMTTTSYCNNCGVQIPEANVRTCDGCGLVVKLNDDFCGNCGATIDQE